MLPALRPLHDCLLLFSHPFRPTQYNWHATLIRNHVIRCATGYIYQANQGGQQQGGAPHQQARQQRQAGARPNPLADLFGGLGLGGSQPAGGGAGSGGSGSQSAPGSMQAAHGAQAAAQHPQQAPAASGGSTAFSGRGYRLGGGS